MTVQEKNKIADALRQKKADTGTSDTKIANAIGGMSGVLINHVLKNRWEEKEQLVSEDAFRKIASWLGIDEEWVLVKDDVNFLKVQTTLNNAKRDSDARAISAPPGYCKSEAAKDFANRKNVFLIKCSQHYTRKVFLQKMMQAMGMSLAEEGVSQMVDRIVNKLNSTQKPLVILDEADKMSDNLFQFFITFYNETYTNCGFVLIGSVFFRIRVLKGVDRNRQGYAEFYSRIGRHFHLLHELTEKRVAAMCKANGVTDVDHIKRVWNECGNDIRRVKRMVQDIKKVLGTEKKVQLALSPEMEGVPA